MKRRGRQRKYTKRTGGFVMTMWVSPGLLEDPTLRDKVYRELDAAVQKVARQRDKPGSIAAQRISIQNIHMAECMARQSVLVGRYLIGYRKPGKAKVGDFFLQDAFAHLPLSQSFARYPDGRTFHRYARWGGDPNARSAQVWQRIR